MLSASNSKENHNENLELTGRCYTSCRTLKVQSHHQRFPLLPLCGFNRFYCATSPIYTHFVLSAFLGFLWSVARIFIPAPSGRQRFNVLGALNAITHEMITVTNDTYITAQSVCVLLEKIAAHYIGIPITLILDNARYQRCALVMEKARSLNIE